MLTYVSESFVTVIIVRNVRNLLVKPICVSYQSDFLDLQYNLYKSLVAQHQEGQVVKIGDGTVDSFELLIGGFLQHHCHFERVNETNYIRLLIVVVCMQ